MGGYVQRCHIPATCATVIMSFPRQEPVEVYIQPDAQETPCLHCHVPLKHSPYTSRPRVYKTCKPCNVHYCLKYLFWRQ